MNNSYSTKKIVIKSLIRVFPEVIKDGLSLLYLVECIHTNSISKHLKNQLTPVRKYINQRLIENQDKSRKKDAICQVTKYNKFFPVLHNDLDLDLGKSFEKEELINKSNVHLSYGEFKESRRRNIQKK